MLLSIYFKNKFTRINKSLPYTLTNSNLCNLI